MVHLALSPKAANLLAEFVSHAEGADDGEQQILDAIHTELQSQLSKSKSDPIPDAADKAARAAATAARKALD